MKTSTGMILLAVGMIGLLAQAQAGEMPAVVPAYRVMVQGTDQESASLAVQLEDDVCGALLSRGYRITKNNEDGSQIVDIVLVVTREEVGRMSHGRMYEGTVRAEVVSNNGNLMGKKRFQTRGEQFLDKKEADADTARRLAQQINEWLPTVLEPVYRVRVLGTDPESASLAAQVEDAVCGALVFRGYRIGKDQEAGSRIVDIQLKVTREEVARLDDWRMYEGTVHAEVVSDGGNLMGKKGFRARGGRSLEETAAEKGLANGLARQINEWLSAVLPPAKS